MYNIKSTYAYMIYLTSNKQHIVIENEIQSQTEYNAQYFDFLAFIEVTLYVGRIFVHVLNM